MRTLLGWYPGDAAAMLAIAAAVQVVGLVVLGLLLSRTLARRNPAALYGVWRCVLACVPLGLVAAWGFQQAGVAMVRLPWLPADCGFDLDGSSQGAASWVNGSSSGAARSGAMQRGNSTTINEAPPLTWADQVRAAITGLFAVWLAGAAFFAARLVWGVRSVLALRRELRPLDPRQLGNVSRDVRRTLGVAAIPPVGTSSRVGSPLSLGIFRPVIILPAHLSNALRGRALRDVLVHECAHILNHDHAIGLVERLVQIVFWPHPLIYVLRRELGRAREELCDNYVLRGLDGAPACRAPAYGSSYARTLLEISQQARPHRGALAGIGFLEPRPRLERRVAGLLDQRRKLVTRISGLALALLALGLSAATITIAGARLVRATPGAVDDEPGATGVSPVLAAKHGQDARGTRSVIVPGVSPVFVQSGATGVSPVPVARHGQDARGTRPASATGASPAFARSGATGVSPVPVARHRQDARAATPAETVVADAETTEPANVIAPHLNPAMRIERDGLGYLVSLQLREGVEAIMPVDPGRPERLSIEQGMHEQFVLEVTVEADAAPDQVRIAYRLSRRLLAEGVSDWHAEQATVKLGAWMPLVSNNDKQQPAAPAPQVQTLDEFVQALRALTYSLAKWARR